jgi:hypothetical protein
MEIPVTVIDEIADVRHALAFIRASVPEMSGYGKLQTDVLSGYELIIAKVETRLREIEKNLECLISQKENERFRPPQRESGKK